MQQAESESGVRSVIGKVQAKVRRWLLGDVQAGLDCLLLQHALVLGTGENQVRQNALVLKELEELRGRLSAMENDVLTLRESELSHNRGVLSAIDSVHIRSDKSLAAIATVGESVDRLVELVTPKAERLQGRRPPVGGWDQVVVDNLKQFEEPAK